VALAAVVVMQWADGAATPVLSMSFETTRFLGQDYVSTDQLQAAMMATEKRAAAAGAKAGAAQVTSKLQQSPSLSQAGRFTMSIFVIGNFVTFTDTAEGKTRYGKISFLKGRRNLQAKI
jgi:hypothetical protein